MRLFDTHCHFETDSRAELVDQLRRARAAGVEKLMAVGGSELLNRTAALVRELGGGEDLPEVVMAQGWDREQLGEHILQREQTGCANHQEQFPDRVAVGEIGLDYHYSPETRSAQLELFAAQLEVARQQQLPVVIHTREADDDTLAVLREIPSRGIIHCYTGTPEFARQLLDLGFYISISGIVTFKAAENVRESALIVPEDRILIETDAPFLAPVPMRGNPNEPAFIAHTCRFLAKLRGMDETQFAELTFANAEAALS